MRERPFSSPILGIRGKIRRRSRLRGRRRKRVGLNYTEELGLEVPHEPNHRTEARWRQIKAELLRFVDDGSCLSKINYENSLGFEVNGVMHRVKHAIQAQNVFRHMVRREEAIGIKVNAAKPVMVCFNDASSYSPDAYIVDADGNRLRCQPSMKALGMRLSNRPDMGAHVQWISRSIRQRFWTLRNLKKSGFTDAELV